MNVSLNEKVRQRDLQNLISMKYSKERSYRVFRIYSLLMLPTGGLLYTILDAFLNGLKPVKASVDVFVLDGLMMLGGIVYILAMNFLLGFLIFGVPILITATWLAYRTYARGTFGNLEAMAVSFTAIALFCSAVALVWTGGVSGLYELLLKHWLQLIPFLVIAPACAVFCRWIVRGIDSEDSLAALTGDQNKTGHD